MIKIDIKPLSVNKAFKGRRFKSNDYAIFEKNVLLMLPNSQIPEGKLCINYVFGFSSQGSDIGNPEKLITDILSKKYGFNDNRIYEMNIKKEIVKKGCEFFAFDISEIII